MCTCVFFLHQEFFDMILINNRHFMMGCYTPFTNLGYTISIRD
jgi:hypothetical protein